jgi:hypothetical protein
MVSLTARVVSRPPTTRSAISNGSRILEGIDGRSTGARRFKDLIENFSRDMGGIDRLSKAEQTLVRQAASLTMRGEQLQATIVKSEPVDPDELIRLSNTARRCLEAVQRREQPKPSLAEHLAKKGAGA